MGQSEYIPSGPRLHYKRRFCQASRMAKRDEASHSLLCPECGAKGEVDVSEDDHPYSRDSGFSVDAISHGFKVVRVGKTYLATTFRCENCGTVFT